VLNFYANFVVSRGSDLVVGATGRLKRGCLPFQTSEMGEMRLTRRLCVLIKLTRFAGR